MKDFISKKPLTFAIGLVVISQLLEILVFITGSSIGIPEIALVITVLLISTAIPIGFIWRLGWWKDAGFVTTTYNVPALLVPFLLILIPLLFFGTVEIEPGIAGVIIVFFFLTALSEEAMSRGLLVRVFLPQGKLRAVLIPSVLFALLHLTQLLHGMALESNLFQIFNAFVSGLLYGSVRLRINNIWPLIAIHMLFDISAGISGVFGPAAVYELSDIPITIWLLMWIPSLLASIYLIRKPSTATIDGQQISN
ncbi:MAG: CPBP family intramembrane glutamic endopeptidase [Candidatus Hydrothermarchaeales archaeon]